MERPPSCLRAASLQQCWLERQPPAGHSLLCSPLILCARNPVPRMFLKSCRGQGQSPSSPLLRAPCLHTKGPAVSRVLMKEARPVKRAEGFLVRASDGLRDGGKADTERSLSIAGLWFSKRDVQIAAGAALVIAFSVANRVLYKMALVPMKEYPFFLALFNTFGYVLVYFSILYARYRAHVVTDEMLKLPKSRFVAVGFLEALGLASGMAAAAVLPGASIPVLSQTFLVWQLIFSIYFLKKRYSLYQILGCALVLGGVILALTSTSSGFSFSSDQAGLLWPFVMIISASLQAGASIIKEFVFRDASERLESKSVDIFVVNSFGSLFQSLFVLLLLPFLSQVKGIPFSELPGYVKDGAGCLFNIGSHNIECNNATPVTFGYIAMNLAFNISLLSLLKSSSAVVASLCTTLAVPLSIFVFTLPLPYVGAPASLPPQFLFGTAVLICGLAFYNFADRISKKLKDAP